MATRDFTRAEHSAPDFARNVNGRNPIKKIDWVLFVVVLLGLIAAASLGFGTSSWYLSDTPDMGAAKVSQMFVDVDGDGRLDLLVKGEVIFNAPPLEVEPSQTLQDNLP